MVLAPYDHGPDFSAPSVLADVVHRGDDHRVLFCKLPLVRAGVQSGGAGSGQQAVLGYLGQAMPQLADMFLQPSVAAELCAGIAAVLWLLQLHSAHGLDADVPFPELCAHQCGVSALASAWPP